jgi:AsmA family protein
VNISTRWSGFGHKTRILLGTLLALALLVVLFDWNWFRQPLERYLSERAHRAVQIKDLHVSLGLEPTVRLRGVHIENAQWAHKQPMANAGEISLTFSLRSVWEERPVISLLVLTDAEVNMERMADGLRNWRLTHPEDTSPGKVKVLTLEAHRATVEFIDHGLDLDLLVSASSAEPGASGGANSPDNPLPTRLDFSGTYQNAKFSGQALTGNLLSFKDSGKSFPVRGHLISGQTRIDVDGTIADAFKPSAIDAKVRLTGPTLDNLYPFLRLPLPASHPYQIEGQLTQTKHQYTFAKFHGKIGATDIAGDASYTRDTPRPLLDATLRSESAALADLGPLVGFKAVAGAVASKEQATLSPARAAAAPAGAHDAESKRAGHVLPDGKMEVGRLRAIDAHATLEAKKLKSPDILALESLRVTGDLNDGVLTLNPLDFGFAGGHVIGVIALNAQGQPLTSRAVVDLRGIRLDKLLPEFPALAQSAGSIGAQVKLTGEGTSIASILGNSSGSLAIAMEGGRISNLLDAASSLNGGKVLGVLLGGDHDIAIRCAAIAVDFSKGLGQSKILVFDTEQTRTEGSGTINLRDETFDFLLRPKPKRAGILSLRAPVRLYGSFKHADYSIDKRIVLARAGGAVLLAAINPFAVFLPLLETGQAGDSQCANVLGAVPAAQANEGLSKKPKAGAQPGKQKLAR